MIDTKAFYEGLCKQGVDAFFGVPDSLLKDFCACASDLSAKDRFVIAANEGNAVGMACGWHVATGNAACVYMQNSGEGNAVNPLLSLADPDVYSIPMLLLIGWRGEPGVHDEPQHVKQGKVTTSLLEAMGIPYEVLREDDWDAQVGSLLAVMRSQSRPVALVVRKNTFSPWAFHAANNGHALSREEALGVLLEQLGSKDLVVSTTGKESREVFELREAAGQGHASDFLTVGGMGHTSSIAWGMALGAPAAEVWCLDGDGSFVMHLGALAVVAQHPLSNLRYVINVNGAHESVGGQPNVAGDIDVPAIIRACGISTVVEARTADEIRSGMQALKDAGLSAMVIYTHQGSRANLGRPTTTPQENKTVMMKLAATLEEGHREGADI